MYVQHHRYEVSRFFESKTHFKSFINHYTLERLYILFYFFAKVFNLRINDPMKDLSFQETKI
jgi:hypothetical protein